MSAGWRMLLGRAAKFYGVGAVGIAVQLGALVLYRQVFGLHYLLATALAVETAVLHNFVWHERFTWSDRASVSAAQALWRLLRFNASTGAVSLIGNLAIMRLLVGTAHVPYVAANLAAIVATGLLNFLASEFWVFRRRAGQRCCA